MIGGLLVDAIVVGAIVAFEWAGPQLGAEHAVRRAIACAVAFLAAALLRDPLGDIITDVLGASVDFGRLAAMLAVGFGVYVAASRVLQWRDAQRVERIFAGYDSEESGSPLLAALDGALLGFCWAVLFIAMLVLLPADNLVSRAAVKSVTGGILIRQESGLQWLSDGFPHYTQTLPKGKLGAVVGEQASLPMHGDDAPEPATRDADDLLRFINTARRAQTIQPLAFNPDMAKVARRHAAALVTDRSLSYRTPTGGTIDDRVRASLGGASGSFDEEVGIEVAWAHSPANAGTAMLEDDRAGRLLRDERWTEIGIGVADAGWFNGRIYVLFLVGPIEDDGGEEADDGTEPSVDDVGADGAAAAAGVPDEPFVGEDECPDPIDLDGDGTPDEQSISPTCAEREADGDAAADESDDPFVE